MNVCQPGREGGPAACCCSRAFRRFSFLASRSSKELTGGWSEVSGGLGTEAGSGALRGAEEGAGVGSTADGAAEGDSGE